MVAIGVSQGAVGEGVGNKSRVWNWLAAAECLVGACRRYAGDRHRSDLEFLRQRLPSRLFLIEDQTAPHAPTNKEEQACPGPLTGARGSDPAIAEACGSGQQSDDFIVGGLSKVVIVEADRSEVGGRGKADDFIRLGGKGFDRRRRCNRDGGN